MSIGRWVAYAGAAQGRSAGHQRLVLYSALAMVKCMRCADVDPLYSGLAYVRRPVTVCALSVHGRGQPSSCGISDMRFRYEPPTRMLFTGTAGAVRESKGMVMGCGVLWTSLTT